MASKKKSSLTSKTSSFPWISDFWKFFGEILPPSKMIICLARTCKSFGFFYVPRKVNGGIRGLAGFFFCRTLSRPTRVLTRPRNRQINSLKTSKPGNFDKKNRLQPLGGIDARKWMNGQDGWWEHSSNFSPSIVPFVNSLLLSAQLVTRTG